MLFKQKIQYMYLAQIDRCHEIDQEVFLFFVISAVTVNTGQYTYRLALMLFDDPSGTLWI